MGWMSCATGNAGGSGALRGCPPLEGVAEDARAAAARGKHSPSISFVSKNATISAGSIRRPCPTSPQASSPAGDSRTVVPSKLRSASRLRLTAGELYIATFIAGAMTRGHEQLMKQRLTGSSAIPQANLPMAFAVAGTTR